LAIANAFNGEPAHAAGLSANDVIVAIDGLRVTPGNLDALLARYRAGDTVTVHAFRRDELMNVPVKLATPPAVSVKLIASDKAALEKRKLRKQWLSA
jgi:predicted metalloprotease with PDZ domain